MALPQEGPAQPTSPVPKNPASRVWRLEACMRTSHGKDVAELLKENSQVVHLEVDGAAWLDDEDTKTDNEGLETFSKAAADMPALRFLAIRRHALTGMHCEAMFNRLARSSSISQLSLRGCRLAAPDVAVLAGVVMSGGLPHLTSLLLSMNDFGDRGVEALVTMLRHGAVSRTLEQLVLEQCLVEARGAVALASVLGDEDLNVRLKALDLSCNEIGDDGGKRLGEALMNNRHLTSLKLTRCRVGDETLSAIGAALPTNLMLSRLDLGGNSFVEEEAGLAFMAGVEKNVVLQYIGVPEPRTWTGSWRDKLYRESDRIRQRKGEVVKHRMNLCHLLTSIGQRTRDKAAPPLVTLSEK